jgi:transcriptional regulator with XRE-family HTH domain
VSTVGSDGLPWEAAFAKNVKAARERRGWSQTELAKRLTARSLPFHQQQVQRIEAGARPVRLNEAIVLAEVLGEHFEDMTNAPDSQAVRRNLIVAMGRVSYLASDLAEYLEEHLEDIDKASESLTSAWDEYKFATERMGDEVDTELEAEVAWFERRTERFRKALSALWSPLADVAAERSDDDSTDLNGGLVLDKTGRVIGKVDAHGEHRPEA